MQMNDTEFQPNIKNGSILAASNQMKQIIYLISTIVGLFLASNRCFAGFIATELLGRPTATSITINACADSAMQVYYQYGTDSTNYESETEVIACQDSIPFVCVIENLNPNTQYFYRMRYRPEGTDQFLVRANHSFRTAKTDNNTFRFAVEADPHMDTNSNASVYVLTLQNIQEANPDFLIDLGDNFFTEKYPPYSQERTLERHLLLRSFYDIACHSVPLFLVLGNHEGEDSWRLDGSPDCLPIWATNTRKAYFPNPIPDNFYSGDTTQYQYLGNRESYYSWEWGNALFVVLDPFWYAPRRQGPFPYCWRLTLGRTQYDWFTNVLQQSNARFKFVFIHQLVGGNTTDSRGGIESAPFYEMGGLNPDSTWGFDEYRPGWEIPLHDLMANYGVTILFHGHDHFYAKQDLDNIVYQLVPQPSSNNFSGPNQAAEYGYINGTLLPPRGYLLVTVSDSICQVDYIRTFLPEEVNGQRHNGDISDSYSIIRSDSSNHTGNCVYRIGDINGDSSVLGGDVTYGVRFFKLIGNRPPDSCYMDSTHSYLYVAGDVNGNCEFRGSDITRLVAYFKLIAPLQYCHFFPPPLRRRR